MGNSSHEKISQCQLAAMLWHCCPSEVIMKRKTIWQLEGSFLSYNFSLWFEHNICLSKTRIFFKGIKCSIITVFFSSSLVFIMASGLLVYPFGFNSATVKRFCENSDIYYAGDCQIGWGYMLAIVGVMLSVFLPFFAKYAPKEHISPTPIPTIL